MVSAEYKFGMMNISNMEPTRTGMMFCKYIYVVSNNYKIIDLMRRKYYINSSYNNNTVLIKNFNK